MRRVLLVLRGRVDAAAIAELYQHVDADSQTAIAYVRTENPSTEQDGLDGLDAQRAITAGLREVLDDRAEHVAVFVVSAATGERVEDYASAWGATEVVA